MTKKLLILWTIILSLSLGSHVHSAYEGEDEGKQAPSPYEYGEEKTSGWFLGSDQGILFFFGDSSDVMGAQYYGTVFGGYNFKGYVQPTLRIGQAFGSSEDFFNESTYWFIMEGGLRVTPLRTKVRPFLSAMAGFYVLDFDDFFSLASNEVNFTFSAGAGIEVAFGRNNLTLGSEYRRFQNSGFDLNGVSVSLGYYFQF